MPTEEEKKIPFGLIGLGVMGRNLALNVEEHGFPVAGWDHSAEKVDRFLQENPGKRILGAKTLEEFVGVLEPPRRILMMVPAGEPVDLTLERLKSLLDRDDIVVDGGNSWFQDTRRREATYRDHFRFIGSGVSGGAEGARRGPSLMPGGSPEAYEHLRPIFEAIAAKTDAGPCVTYVGPDGSGHFVKMVHNGIEYGDMQLIAEAYDLLRRVLGLSASELSDVFEGWNRGRLDSFLIELTSKVLQVIDEKTGKPLVDLVLDKAGQKGTGRWTAQVALDLGVPIPTIAAAIDARVLSSMKEERVSASEKIEGPSPQPFRDSQEGFIDAVEDALYASKICSYAQGMNLIRAGSERYRWRIDLSEMARIWKGGCIIRARFLDSILQAYTAEPGLPNLLLDPNFTAAIQSAQKGWRHVVQVAQEHGIPVPAMSASLAYFDSYRTAALPQNLTQAQRDAFGSHTYERIDEPQRGFIHTAWLARVSQGGG